MTEAEKIAYFDFVLGQINRDVKIADVREYENKKENIDDFINFVNERFHSDPIMFARIKQCRGGYIPNDPL